MTTLFTPRATLTSHCFSWNKYTRHLVLFFLKSCISLLTESWIDEQHWIGLNDLNQEMYYEWDDGSEVEFTTWNYLEPNNSGEEDCVQVYYSVSILCVYNTKGNVNTRHA